MSSADRALSLPAAGDGAGYRLARRCGVDLRPDEGPIAVVLFLYFFLIITFQYISKSVRQSTFIDDLGAESLPIVYLVLALCSIPVLWLYSRLVDRVRRHHLIAATQVVVAASMIGFWWLYQFDGTWIRVAFYLWISVVFVLNVSQFWSYSNHVLDSRQAKRLFGFIGAGGLVGGIAGGQVARFASSLVDTRFALLVAAAALVLATALIFVVQRVHGIADEPAGGAAGLARLEQARGGLAEIRRSRHLTLIAAVMLITITVANVVDVQFNWAMDQATREIEGGSRLDALTGGYGDFYTIMGISALIFQLLFTARIHRRLGIGFAMRVLPVTMGLGTLGLFFAATSFPLAMLMVCRVLKIGETGLRYSLDQATRELLFLPVPSRARLKAKAYIDVFVQRSGKATAGLLLLPVTFGRMTVVQAGWISLVLIVVWLVVVAATRREYVRSFRTGLRKRTIDAGAPINLRDVTTLEILVEWLGSADRRQVLHGLELLAANGRGNLVPPLLLCHDDTEVRLATLRVLGACERMDAAPLVERRLGDDDPAVRAQAILTLAALRREDAGTLMLPRLRDPDRGIRAAAIASLAGDSDPGRAAAAHAALERMIAAADRSERIEAARAIEAAQGGVFQEQLVRLLYDSDPGVARAAVTAVPSRVAAGQFTPVYLPILISMLRNRRLKHESREALVAVGEPAIPVLVHFMNDPQESLWVRRALPKTVARIGTTSAVEALIRQLDEPGDTFLRRKVVEALNLAARSHDLAPHRPHLREAIRHETRGYLQALLRLQALGAAERGRLDGPLVRWDREDVPSLLEHLLAGRMEDHLGNIFGLLSALHATKEIRAAQRSLHSANAAVRTSALEYLDNALSGEIRKLVFAVVGDTTLEERIRDAGKLHGLHEETRTVTLQTLLDAGADAGGEPAPALCAAALYTVYTERVAELYPQVEATLARTVDPFVRETAEWVASRLRRAAAP